MPRPAQRFRTFKVHYRFGGASFRRNVQVPVDYEGDPRAILADCHQGAAAADIEVLTTQIVGDAVPPDTAQQPIVPAVPSTPEVAVVAPPLPLTELSVEQVPPGTAAVLPPVATEPVSATVAATESRTAASTARPVATTRKANAQAAGSNPK